MDPAYDFSYDPAPVQQSYLPWSITTLVSMIFWGWIFYDCIKRYGGFNFWHWLFIVMPPSVLIYFLVHIGRIFSGRGGAFSGLGVKSRIKKAQQQLRVSDTLAARAELAELYFQNGQHAECESEYARVLAADPQNLEALYYTGLCRMKQGDPAAALALLEQVMARDRKLRFGVAWLRYTECLVAVGRHDEALEERKKLARAFPRPMTEFAYAQLLNDTGKKDAARAVLEDMLATSDHAPSEDRTWLKQGRTLLRAVG